MLGAAAVAAALFTAPPAAQHAAAQQQQQVPVAARAVVGAVQVEGARRVPADQIQTMAGLQVGDSITAVDVDRAVRRVFGLGQFRDVQVFVDADPQNAAAPVTVRFVVEEQPLVGAIEFRGLQNVRAATVRDTVGLRAGRPYEPRRAVEAEAMVRELLGQKGFQVRSVAHRLEPIEERADEVRLVFDVVEGQRVAIADIGFVGNEAFTDAQLRGAMDTRREGFLWTRQGTFDEDRLREDLRASLPQFYARHGYIDFAVVGDSLVVDPETGKGRLLIQVDEGRQYRLAEFDVRGASRFATDDLRRYFEERRSGGLFGGLIGGARERGTQPGEIFDAVAFQDATGDVHRLYTNQGYLYVQVQPVIERVPASADEQATVRVAWEIEEGQPASVRRVSIVGNTFTHESVIRNQIMMLPGDVYSEELLIASYRRISALGFFETPMPMPRIEPDQQTGEVDITFEVREKQTGSVGFGTSLGGSLGLTGFLTYEQPNLFGQAKSGNLRWEFGRFSNNFEAGYSDPAILGSWLSGSLSLFSSRDRFFTFQEGQRRRTGMATRVGIPTPWDRYARFTTGYSLSRTTYENFEDDESAQSLFSLPPGVQSTISFGLSRMALDHPLFPTMGTRLDLDASLSGGPLGGDGDFQKYTVNGAWYVPVGSLGGGQPGTRPVRFTLGLGMEAGALFGDASRFPFDRFWMGGVQFGRPLRGYEETTVTPRGFIPRGAVGVPLEQRFGDAYLRLSAEYAVRFTDNISVNAFYDAGNVWRNPAEMNPTRLMRGAGVGLMLVTPFGPLGLDYAYGFDKDQPGWQLHFKFGQGF